MQKTSLLHPFILEIQSVLESCDQTGHTQTFFDQLLFEFVSTCKKLGYFRPVIEENTTRVVQHAKQHILLVWCVIFDCMPYGV